MNNGRGGSTTGVWRVKHRAMMDGQGSTAANPRPAHRRPSALTPATVHLGRSLETPSAFRHFQQSDFGEGQLLHLLFVLLRGLVAFASLSIPLDFSFFSSVVKSTVTFHRRIQFRLYQLQNVSWILSAVALLYCISGFQEGDSGHRREKKNTKIVICKFQIQED